ncbi:MAG: pyridoxal phosphate-dependent aminotransferase [Acidobacteriota bacterium]
MPRRLASRLSLVGASQTMAVKAEADRLRREGRQVIDFGPGEPDLPTPEAAKQAARRAIDDDFTHYTAAAGIHELRAALATYYAERSGQPVGPEEVLVGAGGKSLLFAAMLALLNAGDEVVVVAPYWVSFPEQIRLAGGTPLFARTRAEDGFAIRTEQIAEALTPATVAVIVNSPSNPSGGILPPSEIEQLVELCRERDLWLISDETYEALVYDPQDRSSLLSWRRRLDGRLLYVSAFSKTWAMTGWRIGYAIADAEVVRAMLTVQSHDTTHASSISQRAALAALVEAPQAPQRMLEIYRARRDLMVEGLNRIPGIRCPVPRGAFYAFPDVRELAERRGLDSSRALGEALIRECGVATVPGEAFGAPGHLRLSYATAEELIREGLERIARFAGA